MTKFVRHLQQNLVAYLALFVALGGTTYAALRIPAGSVGNRQLKNHAVTPVKLDGGKTAGYVADWAQIDSGGRIVAARPRGATIPSWNATPNTPGIGGEVRWKNKLPLTCFPVASAAGPSPADAGMPTTVSAQLLPGSVGQPFIGIHESAPAPVNVAVICPIP